MSMSPLAQFIIESGGDDPHECSMFGCDETAVFMIAGEPCGTGCEHMHGIPLPMCAGHAEGHRIVGTTGD